MQFRLTTLSQGLVRSSGPKFTRTLTGQPVAGDSFRLEANIGGVSDNRNALAMAGLQTASLVDNSMSYQQAYSTFVGSAGVAARTAQLNADARDQLLTDVQFSREAVSGVNLDEEAVDLTRYQQAYQAMARMVDTSNTLFDSLLAAVR